MSIGLGTCDAGCAPPNAATYFAPLHETTMGGRVGFRGEQEGEWISFADSAGSQVLELQRFLKAAGFMPFGKLDGICGYRTAGALRLFQEYVRTVEGDASIGAADGTLGPLTEPHVARWRASGATANWTSITSQAPTAEYVRWMRLLERVKARYSQEPTRLLQRVDARIAELGGRTDTLKVADWKFDPQRIQVVGIRCGEAVPGPRANDDVFVALLNGVVFKFYGTTDPGKTENAEGAPFLVPGQHRYRFGWHKMSDLNRVYRALKPVGAGVLVVRDGDRDQALTDSDIDGRLEPNSTINVHWGGRGVSNWSEGCQVICGKGYINHEGKQIDCSAFAATSYGDLGKRVKGVYVTKGAYSVLVDLVAAFSSDVHAVDYMLIYERDLELEPEIGGAAARAILAEIS